jgi:type IV pilus assembly protein PilA
MFCANCGNSLASSVPIGAPASNLPPGPPQPPIPQPLPHQEVVTQPPIQPVSVPPPTYSAPPPSQPPQTSGIAIASLVCGCLFFFFPTALLAVVLGHIAKSQIAKSANRIGGAGIALAGLILGYIGIAIIPFILIIAAIAIPNLVRARMAANEASAVGALRSISVGAISYSSAHGAYPPSLAAMGPNGDATIDQSLALGRRNGYMFEYHLTTTGGGKADGFIVTADPMIENRSGQSHFFIDESGVIRRQRGAPADQTSPPVE